MDEPGGRVQNERFEGGPAIAEITLEGVTKVYGDGTQAVSDLDLDIADGEFMVFVGPSGCGKTTALRMVAGLEEITSGKVLIGETVVNDVPPKDRDVAMVFQNYALYPHMTVFENMAFGLKLQRVPKDEIDRRVRKAAEILGMSELMGKKPRHLSGGQRQRVAMGRAIVREPQAFLMDEPLSNLDAKLRVLVRAEIAKIQRDLGVTTIYVTHDQTEAMTMGDRVAVIRKGMLQQVDHPQVLYDRPVNLFVGGFIGSPTMNMAEADLRQEGDRLFVEFGGYRLRVDGQPLQDRPALAGYVGRRVILGVRPENLEDASLVPDAPTDQVIGATVDLREALGSEVLVHFIVQTAVVLTDDTRELAIDFSADKLQELEAQAASATSKLVAALDPKTKAREGEEIDLFVDTSRLHFFDPETGLGIYDQEPGREERRMDR